VTAEIGQPHTFGNDRDEWTTFTVETRPPGGVVAAFQMAYAVASAGGTAKDGLPRSPIARLAFIRTSQGFLPGVPLFLQRGLLRWRTYFSQPRAEEPESFGNVCGNGENGTILSSY
jgi:hypothetical protein